MVISKEGFRLFIAVDGPDGCGKTTIVDFVKDYLSLNDIPTLKMKALGESDIGQACRKKLLTTKGAFPYECLLMPTSIAETYFECVEPALLQGKSIVVDRWISSYFAYQVKARKDANAKMLYEDIFLENKLSMCWPDLYFICNVSINTAEQRMNRRPNEKTTLDNESKEFKKLVHKGFNKFSEIFGDSVINIDCNRPITEVLNEVRSHINKVMMETI